MGHTSPTGPSTTSLGGGRALQAYARLTYIIRLWSPASSNLVIANSPFRHENISIAAAAMPSDEYSSAARGPLKLKGAKVAKPKKKSKSKRDRDKTASGVERALSVTDDHEDNDDAAAPPTTKTRSDAEDGELFSQREAEQGGRERENRSGSLGRKQDGDKEDGEKEEEEEEEDIKTEAERRFAEAKRKRVCVFFIPSVVSIPHLLPMVS